MNEKLNFNDLVDLLAQRAEIEKKKAESFFKEFFALISTSLSEDEPVKIKDFGAFKLIRVQSRESVDVNTGEKIEIPSYLRLVFLPASELKELVNKPFSHFETTLLNEGITFDSVPDFDDEDTSEEFVAKQPEVEKIELPKLPETVAEQQPEPQERIVYAAEQQPVRKQRKTKRSKKTDIFVPVLGAVAIAAAVLFFFVQIGRNTEEKKNNYPPQSVVAETEEIVLPLPDTTTAVAVPEPQKEARKVTLTAGKTLRLIALEKFGNKEFWVYIYYKNKDRINNPNIVPVGTELLLPDKSEYDMDVANSVSVAKAKILGDKEFEKYR